MNKPRKTKVLLPYGNETISLEIPTANLLAVAEPGEVVPRASLKALLHQALEKPISGVPFSEKLEGNKKLLLLVDDLTRPTPIKRILPLLLEELEIEKKKIDLTILIALGTHRKMTLEEIHLKVGQEIAENYRVVNHEWEDESALVDLGVTSNGTPIMINPLIQECDVCIGIGNIAPHNLAGWSGGGKIVQPGICGKETTFRTHLLAARSPSSNMGKMFNPVRVEIEKVAAQTNFTGVVNTILDRHGEVIHIVAGESRSTYIHGVQLARPIWEVPVPGLADIVISSSHPADIDFWQANKGLFSAERVVKRGGEIILVTPCPEGISSIKEHAESILALEGVPSRDLYHEAVRRGLEDYAALAVSTISATCCELARVTVVSDGLSAEQAAMLGFDYAHTVDEALERAFERQGKKATVLILTHGGEIVPVISGDSG